VTRTLRLIVLLACSFGSAAAAAQTAPTPAREMYASALEREKVLRGAHAPTLAQYRAAVRAYDAVVRAYPASGYADNALWQGGTLALEAFEHFGEEHDQAAARRLLDLLADQYRFSPLSAKARESVRQIDAKRPTAARAGPPPTPATAPPAIAPSPAPAAQPPRRLAMVKDVRRSAADDGVRVIVELDGAAPYRSETVESPHRMFVDIADTRLGTAVVVGTLSYEDDVVRKVRIGRHPNNVTRVVVDLSGIKRYTVKAETSPPRIVIECERTVPVAPATKPVAPPASRPDAAAVSRPPADSPAPSNTPPAPVAPPRAAPPRVRPLESHPIPQTWGTTAAVETIDVGGLLDHTPPPAAAPPRPSPLSEPTKPAGSPTLPAAEPGPPSSPARSDASAAIPPRGSYSMSRQLGLGASKIVIDPGHGGHDPGALGPGMSEADVVLDVSLRLEALLKEAGFAVVLTRRTDAFVPLEERPAIATREQADLFLSIHANASRDRTARGIETYILHFANDPDSAAVAVRENAATDRRMNSLPDIVKAITLNNKFDESRSFAGLVQRAMADQLRAAGQSVVDHGVKQAPFVVLIGAAMPSVLVEISFITNTQEGRLLKTPAYRQRIAQALFDGIRGYQRSLKLVAPELPR
jgi:N-acetylmuramoyl-L-alanine amidase